MILKEVIKKVITIQKEKLEAENAGIKRELLTEIDDSTNHAIIISGIRRCGKSTLLHQIIKKNKNYAYINFEDPRLLGFELSDFEKLEEVFLEIYQKPEIFFFDEIQNVPDWERYIRKMQDEKKKIVITSSNASLLSKELGTKLTGRHLTYELYPFSYSEFLKYKNEEASAKTFDEYQAIGGFPEYIQSQNMKTLQELFSDILYKDIIVRYKLRDEATLKKLAEYCITNIGKEISYNNLKKIFNTGSVNTIISYLSYFQGSYLILEVPRFYFSLKKQIISQKKIYSIDPSIIRANSGSFSEDAGRILENLVFLHLKRKYKDIYYFKEQKECDFIVKEKQDVILAIQVCHHLTSDNMQREAEGLKEAMKITKAKKGIIITNNQSDNILGFEVIPAWKFLTE